MSNDTKLAVVEGKWFKDRNISIRSLFDMVSDLNCGSPHEYHYEMFNDGNALQEIIRRLASKDNVYNVYIAAHGSDESLFGSNGEAISITKVRNAIKAMIEAPGVMHSIYFGSCNFGNISNLKSLLQQGSVDKTRWIAGYTEPIEFIKSSVLDALFWNLYIKEISDAPLTRIQNVCKILNEEVGGLIEDLGFKVLAWDQRTSEGFVELT